MEKTVLFYLCCIIATVMLYNYNEQVKEDDTGWACSTNGEKRNAYTYNIHRKARKKEITRETKEWMGGYY
jgi:hypothetical protein